MKDNDLVIDLAKNNNFDEVHVINPKEFTQYKIDTLKYNIDYDISSNPRDIMDDVKSIIVLITKYNPYDITYFTKEHAIVDAYYVASNASYANSKNMAEDILSLGFSADYNARIPYRHCAIRAGIQKRGIHGLLFHPEYGNYFTIQCILTNMPLDITADNNHTDICTECNICIDACTYGALNPSGIVTRHKCKRDYMPARKYIHEEMRDFIDSELIGCRTCRAVCPVNKRIAFVTPPQDLLDSCYMPRLMDFDSNENEFNTLVRYIGKNEIRKLRLAKSLVIIAGNTGNTNYIPLIKNINKRFNDDELNEYADWAIDKLS